MKFNRFTRRLGIENLEGRRLMACDVAAEVSTAAASLGAVFARAAAPATVSVDARLVGRLTPPAEVGGNGTGAVKFETITRNGTTRSEFEVRVANLAANTTYSVTVDEVAVGTITTDARGRGKLEFKTGSATNPLPDGFAPAAGAVVNLLNESGATVLSTALATLTRPVVENRKVLTTRLSDPTSATTLKGGASYATATVNGQEVRVFAVGVHKGEANATIDVLVDGVKVGTIKLDAKGRGGLVFSTRATGGRASAFPDNFPTTVTAGSTITVGTATGTLAVPTRRR